jgi:predicted TIM-barrel fold metal-dependent hydrolase
METSTETAPARETLRSTFVVDVDAHVREDVAAMAEYAENPWDVALAEAALGVEQGYYLRGVSTPVEMWPPFPGGSSRDQTVRSAAQMRRELDELHIDQAILFPDLLLTLATVPHPLWATAIASSYNAWLYERWLLEEPTLKGALAVAPQDPEAAAADIRHHADHREFACIYLPAAGVRPLYGHRSYDPIYEAAVEVGLPVAIHSVTVQHPAFPFQLDGFETPLGAHAVAHPFAMMANIVSLLETGVPVRHPELKICFVEAGVSWVPFLMNRLDKEYVERRREVPYLQERPSHYMRQWYYGTQPIEEPERRADIVGIFELFDGENCAMFASDWPHHDFDHPQHVFGLPFSPEARRKIMGENAARFFALDR